MTINAAALHDALINETTYGALGEDGAEAPMKRKKEEKIPYKRACRGHRVHSGYTILLGVGVRRGNVREVHGDNPAPPSLRDGGALRGACRARPMSVCRGPLLMVCSMVR